MGGSTRGWGPAYRPTGNSINARRTRVVPEWFSFQGLAKGSTYVGSTHDLLSARACRSGWKNARDAGRKMDPTFGRTASSSAPTEGRQLLIRFAVKTRPPEALAFALRDAVEIITRGLKRLKLGR
jgi:hypothetical protein